MSNDVGQFIFNFSMAIATIWMVNKFWSIFFEKKQIHYISAAVLIIYFVFQLYFEYNKGHLNIWMIVGNILLIFFIAVSAYKSKGILKIFLLVVFFAVWSLIEMFVFLFMKTILAGDNLDIAGAISKIMLLFVIYIFTILWRKKKQTNIPNTYYFLLF